MTRSVTLPMVLTALAVHSATRLSPSFVRVALVGEQVAEIGVDGPLYDQRIKLVFPRADGTLPPFEDADESWLSSWLDRPADERGHMRTYTIRDLRTVDGECRLTVDIVVHEGASGPGSRWALAARPGAQVVVLAPRRGVPFGGIEFAPGAARQLLLAGDETALPAIASILSLLPADAQGVAFVEVPVSADGSILAADVIAPAGVEVVWLPRDGAPLGAALIDAVADHMGQGIADVSGEVQEEIWETPVYSSSGEAVAEDAAHADELYAWIAGESGVVTGIRRMLVTTHGLNRRQVAFMGYWRQGVAMRS